MILVATSQRCTSFGGRKCAGMMRATNDAGGWPLRDRARVDARHDPLPNRVGRRLRPVVGADLEVEVADVSFDSARADRELARNPLIAEPARQAFQDLHLALRQPLRARLGVRIDEKLIE